MAAPKFPAGHIVYPIGPLDFKGYLIVVFKKRQIAPLIENFRKIYYFRCFYFTNPILFNPPLCFGEPGRSTNYFSRTIIEISKLVLSTPSAALLIYPYSRFNRQPEKRIGSVGGNNYINFLIPDTTDNSAPYAYPLGYMYQGGKNGDIYITAFFRIVKPGAEQPYLGLGIRLADRVNQCILFKGRYSHIPQ
jgi:hypothetical protein